ncbi:MAG: UbiD family decarboxylase [Deltaproteobacteria bacterium]|nr:UbiD family decarboxylase [Deltaproteobacteria bacterium]
MTQPKEVGGLGALFEQYRARGEVVEIAREVDSECELSGLIVALNNLPVTPPVFFPQVKGYRFPVGGNLFAERRRACDILGLPTDPIAFKEAYLHAMEHPVPPVMVPEAPCQERVLTGQFDALGTVPSIKASLDCGGRYFQPVVVSRDPQGGWRNVAMARSMLLGDNRVAMNIRYETHVGYHFQKAREKGIPFELALVIGAAPEVYIAAVTKMPFGTDELSLAGALRGAPSPVVRCQTLDLEVPASAEFVLEGVIEPPYEEAVEGPWPEFLKYLSIPRACPVMRITAVTHRERAMHYAVVAGTKDNYALRISNDVSFYRYVKALDPNFVVDATLTPGTAYWHHGIIQVRKDSFEKEGLQINVALAAFGFSMYLETVTVVDEDVNILDMNEIDWAVCTRCNPGEQLHILPEGRTHRNNPIAGVHELLGDRFVGKSKLIVDATVPWKYKQAGRGGLPLFQRARFRPTDLREYLSPQDFTRWVKR